MIIATVVVGDLDTNCYLVGDDATQEAVVIDPGDEPDRIITEIIRLNLKVKLIINTHVHPDHIAGNNKVREFAQVPIASHPADNIYLKYVGIHKPARELNEGDEICVSTIKLKVIHTPGHTPGSICLYTPGILFSGDTLFADGVGRTDLPGGDETKLRDSLFNRIFKLPEETVVYPGHGPETTIGQEKKLF